jgi:transcriptional regulator with XRE-family HTH domain
MHLLTCFFSAGTVKLPQMDRDQKAVEVGERIVEARKEMSLRQEELADLVGVSQRTMQAYERGEVLPWRKLRELERVLNRPAQWILHGEESVGTPSSEQYQQILEELRAIRSLLEGSEPRDLGTDMLRQLARRRK